MINADELYIRWVDDRRSPEYMGVAWWTARYPERAREIVSWDAGWQILDGLDSLDSLQ